MLYYCCTKIIDNSNRDEAQLTKLQQLGMTPSEETKLLAMRDYILKLANAISRYAIPLDIQFLDH